MSQKFTAAGVVAIAALFSAGAFAQSGGISIPGVGSANGSGGSTLNNTRITVSNNKASNITVGGGELGISVGQLKMSGMANVNSVNVTGSKLTDTTITVTGNEADTVRAIGGTANVNSVNIN